MPPQPFLSSAPVLIVDDVTSKAVTPGRPHRLNRAAAPVRPAPAAPR